MQPFTPVMLQNTQQVIYMNKQAYLVQPTTVKQAPTPADAECDKENMVPQQVLIPLIPAPIVEAQKPTAPVPVAVQEEPVVQEEPEEEYDPVPSDFYDPIPSDFLSDPEPEPTDSPVGDAMERKITAKKFEKKGQTAASFIIPEMDMEPAPVTEDPENPGFHVPALQKFPSRNSDLTEDSELLSVEFSLCPSYGSSDYESDPEDEDTDWEEEVDELPSIPTESQRHEEYVDMLFDTLAWTTDAMIHIREPVYTEPKWTPTPPSKPRALFVREPQDSVRIQRNHIETPFPVEIQFFEGDEVYTTDAASSSSDDDEKEPLRPVVPALKDAIANQPVEAPVEPAQVAQTPTAVGSADQEEYDYDYEYSEVEFDEAELDMFEDQCIENELELFASRCTYDSEGNLIMPERTPEASPNHYSPNPMSVSESSWMSPSRSPSRFATLNGISNQATPVYSPVDVKYCWKDQHTMADYNNGYPSENEESDLEPSDKENNGPISPARRQATPPERLFRNNVWAVEGH